MGDPASVETPIPLGSSLTVLATEGDISSDQTAEWGRFLAERLVGG